jgi:hypothetical protein
MKVLFLLLFYIVCTSLSAQDSVKVYQKNAALFSNYYVFYPDETFKHYFVTDDGGIWYGVGTYSDKCKRRILRFENPDFKNPPQPFGILYESNFVRTLRISGKRFLSKDYYGTTRKKIVVFE